MPWRSPSIAVFVLFAAAPAMGQSVAAGRATHQSEASQAADLSRRITIRIDRLRLDEALKTIAREADVLISYGSRVVPVDRVVSYDGKDVPLREVLDTVLHGLGVEARVVRDQIILVKPSRDESKERRSLAGTVTGRVADAKTGAGVADAEVRIANQWHAVTDTGGRYRLAEVDTGAHTLIVRRVGYAKYSQRVTVREGATEVVNVALDRVVPRLDELVTTATGRRRRMDVPNDITTINADSVMKTAPVHSLTDLLESRVPGLTVQRTSGAPGDPARLRLRGAASPLQNNDPIVVVDGIRVYAKQSDARSANLANRDFAAPSPLDYIDPNTIETIEVVKGASAAALYGPDAANGVIVITTKKGHAGPTRWTMSAAHGRSQMAGTYPDLLFRWGHSSLYDPQNGYCPIISSATCVGDSVLSFQMLNDPALTTLDKGHSTDLSLGASGGTQALTYGITGSYRDELGLIKLPDYEAARYLAIEGRSAPDWMRRPQRLKYWSATSTVGARLGATADVTLTSTLSRTMQQRSTLEQQLGVLMSTFLDRSSGLYYNVDGTSSGFPSNTGVNSFDIASYRSRVTDAATQLATGVNANWRARPWLTLTTTAGLNIDQRASEDLLPRSRDTLYMEGGRQKVSTGTLNLGNGTSILSTVHAGAVAVAPLGRGFSFRVASGVDYTGTSTNDIKIENGCVPYGSSDFGTGGHCNGSISNGSLAPSRSTINDATFGWSLAPAITNPHFSVDLGLQLNGGSAYGGNVSGLKLPTFPKLGFSYLLSEEPFFPLKDVFQSFRVRAAYGRAGTQPGAADRLRLYRTLNVSDLGDVTTVTTLGNTQLKPERTAEFEGGVDADLLDSRLSIQVSGYRRTKQDALIPAPVPPSVYGPNLSMMRNIGVIRNTGLDLNVEAQLVRTSALTWSTSVVFSQNRNKVVRLGPGVLPFYTEHDPPSLGAIGDDQGGIRVAAGYPLFGRWARPVLGYADANGDKVLEPDEIVLGDTAVYVGQTVPTSQFTVRPIVTLWHTLTIAAGLTHDGGVAQKNNVALLLSPFTRGSTDPAASLAEQLATGIVGSTIPANWVQTVTTTRLQDLSVRYTVPPGVARRLGAQQLSVAVQGSNLGLWTNYRGLDPNVNAFATGNNVADTGVLPMPRTWQVQINASY